MFHLKDFPMPELQGYPGYRNLMKLQAFEPEFGLFITDFIQVIEQNPNTNLNNHLVVSPYNEEPHLLDLRTLDIPNQLLAKALVGLTCLRDDYSTAPYVEIFNWSEVIDSLKGLSINSGCDWKETTFYIVVFRSRIPPTTVYSDLGILDKAAHAEATKSGGFLKYVNLILFLLFSPQVLTWGSRYWFGSPDEHGRNLATCVWRNQEDARTGSVGEAHRRAASATRLLYTEWRIERLRLVIEDDVTGWSINQWD